jgi:predicted kinase
MTNKPILMMLIGLPGTGKTTWIKNNRKLFGPNHVVLSTDDILEMIGGQLGMTYNEMFDDISYSFAEKMMMKGAKHAIANKWNVIWDQTNLNVKTRAKKLALFGDAYEKHGIYFPVPPDHDVRLNSRVGKTIPRHVMQSMKEKMEMPSTNEGFDSLTVAAQ